MSFINQTVVGSFTPLLRRGRGRLGFALLFLFAAYFSFAQENTGALPYLNSEHSYRVSIGDAGNDKEWIITDGTTSLTIMSDITPVALPSWATILSTGSGSGKAGTGYHGVKIYFDRTVFTTGNWSLNYYEYDGTHSCISARTFPITISENTFYITLAADENDQCNSQSGLVHPLSELEDAGDVYDTEVMYTIVMNKNAGFDPDTVSFDVNFSQSISSITVANTDGPVSKVTELTAGTDYNIKVAPWGSNYNDVDTVTVSVIYSNTVLADVTNNITVSNGEAVIYNAPAPDAITDDNITVYPQAPGTPGDRVQAITILAVPSTQDIAPGAGESVYTATHPNLLSAHKYVVVMENVANTKSWWIENAAGDYTLVENTDYSITYNASATADTATIDFIDENFDISNPNFVIYFQETDGTTGCSTIRPYAITILPPFDVDIAYSVASSCPNISGTVNDTYGTATTTTLTYVATLITPNYTDGWSFDLEVTSGTGFGAADVDVAAAGISVSSGATYTVGGDKYNGSVSVTGGTTTVTISVQFTGFYLNEHDLTVSLTNITGSFNEEDVDATNTTTNTLNRLPQPEAIAGID